MSVYDLAESGAVSNKGACRLGGGLHGEFYTMTGDPSNRSQKWERCLAFRLPLPVSLSTNY